MSGYILTARDIKDAMVEPANDGTSGQVLTTDGQGGRSWQTIAHPTAPVTSVNGKTGDVVLTHEDTGAAASVHTHDERYYTETETDTLLSGKAAANHDHDGRYYTEAETDNMLSGKSDTGHTHDERYYTETETDTMLSGKAASIHGHAMGDVTGLVSAIAEMKDYHLTETASGSRYFTSDVDTGGRIYKGDDVYAVHKFTLLDMNTRSASSAKTITTGVVVPIDVANGDIFMSMQGGFTKPNGECNPASHIYNPSNSYNGVWISSADNGIRYRICADISQTFIVIEYATRISNGV